ncbi:hypothetical protein MtrunA17_Chr4g0014381 [Medicago truncatula]|uniref:DUF8204 domain-containing protein n=1 Tax=Medicago truncatula TaxID=3880 RepID=G7JP68_MEDTR|nr:uncharacterized protein LOC11432894 isoform X2 [Medicago truncatula]AES87732.1 hypothetical protein MTR_4g032740 [Medicago truncatula]AFK34597.1 unknown [Medicago truncatula]RHN59538.1 hypothetical protein MtrunA17_Chr4g0014381 [Medicago truncatula]
MEEPRDQKQAPPSEQNPNSIPDSNPNPNPNRPRTVKGKSCKGCAYYSSVLKSKSKNPTCYGLSRTLQEVPPYVVGESELEASKEGRKLANFKYACIGYSIYLDNKDSSPDSQDKTAKLPFCVGLEVVSEVNPSTSPVGQVPAHARQTNDREHPAAQPRMSKPPITSAEEFLNRFQKNATLVAYGVVKNLNKVGNRIKESLDDILYRRPK